MNIFETEHHDDHGHDMRGQLADALAARQFMLAGHATVTLVSKRTGTRFTYRLSRGKDKDTGKPTNAVFVGLLTGPDNEGDYSYLGRIAGSRFWAGRKFPRPGDVSRDAPSSRAFAWTWDKLMADAMPAELEIWHEGTCGRCGRKLTVPESVARGFGPECAGKVGL